MVHRNCLLVAFLAVCLCSDVSSFSVQPTNKISLKRTHLASTAEIMEDNPGLAAIQETVVKTTDQETAVHKDSVDLALLGTLASFATLGMLLGLSFNSGIIQSIENSGNGSAATFIVDGVFGAIALFVSLVSGPDDV